jgi:hypothetical protein
MARGYPQCLGGNTVKPAAPISSINIAWTVSNSATITDILTNGDGSTINNVSTASQTGSMTLALPVVSGPAASAPYGGQTFSPVTSGIVYAYMAKANCCPPTLYDFYYLSVVSGSGADMQIGQSVNTYNFTTYVSTGAGSGFQWIVSGTTNCIVTNPIFLSGVGFDSCLRAEVDGLGHPTSFTAPTYAFEIFAAHYSNFECYNFLFPFPVDSAGNFGNLVTGATLPDSGSMHFVSTAGSTSSMAETKVLNGACTVSWSLS